jgi:hypothetical protein
MGVEKGKAQEIADKVIDDVAKNNNIGTENDLKKALRREFASQNINRNDAETLTELSVSTVEHEQKHPELPFTINKQDVQTAIKNNPLFTNQTIVKAVNDTLKNPDITSRRQFFSDLVGELQMNGMSQKESRGYAGRVLEAINDVTMKNPPPVDPLVQANKSPLLDETQLKDAVFTKAVQSLQGELSVPTSHKIAGDLVAALFGDDKNSIFNVLKDSIQTAKKDDTKVGDDRLKEATKKFLAPRVELYVFAEALNDPANSLLYSAASGIMYSGNQTQKHENALQISV